ncbi:MAG: thiol-disulfide oxidoreductase DCC family protein, partial [Bacteroidetes bacterium]|nr:thiol-disulfide oxidoreductase DCC family protein [Bacteroidota bacterium]
KSVVLFDGVCNLCNGAVDFIIRRDRHKRFMFASLQSVTGQQLLKHYQLPTEQYESMVIIRQGKLYQRSNAALQIARDLPAGWSLLYYLKVVPAFLRDGVYNFIARNRYTFFGKKNSCRLPSPEEAARFLG